MSLAEIPASNVRNNSHFVHSQVSQKNVRLQSSLPNGDENSHFPTKPSPIQGMLKNTTEIGNVGQFSVKPPRVPASNLQLSPAPLTKTRGTPSRGRHLQPYYNGQGGYDIPYTSESPRQGSIASSSSSFPAHRNGGLRQRPSIEDYHSHSMTQSPYNKHSVTGRHFFANGQYHSRGDATNARPRSPYAYPTRLRRPGHRPSSPALSALNRATTGYTQGLSREPSTRTASPFSAYDVARTPSPFRYVINRSDADLQHYPLYLNTEPKRSRTPSISSTRPSTPKASPTIASTSNSSCVYRKRSISRGPGRRPKSPPVSPVFYDYTEDFEDSGTYRNSILPNRSLAQQSTLPNEPSIYSESGDSLNSTAGAEQPTEGSSQNELSQAEDLDLKQSTRKVIPFRDNFTPTAPQDLSDVPELPENEVVATGPPVHNQRRWAESRSNLRAVGDIGPQFPEADQQDISAHDGHSGQLPGELAAKALNLETSRVSGRSSSSPSRSMLSVKASDLTSPLCLTPKPLQNLPVSGAAPLMLDNAASDAEQRVPIHRVEGGHPSESLRGPSFEGHSRVSTEILSPTPERSVASPNSRDRFSKILSIYEAPLDEESLIPPLKKEDLAGIPVHGFHKNGPWNTNSAFGPFRRKPSLYTRNSPLKQNLAKDVLVEKSDSEEEPELTAGLRKTFCKNDNTILQLRKMSWTSTSSPRQSRHELEEPATVNQPLPSQDSPATPRASSQDPASKALCDNKRSDDLPAPAPVATEAGQSPDPDMMPQKFPRKHPSFKSYSPPVKADESDLPLDFTPLVRRPSEDIITASVDTVSLFSPEEAEAAQEDDASQLKEPLPEAHSHRNSVASHPGSLGSRPTSRPWNQDSSYPWDAELPALEVTMPQEIDDLSKPAGKAPLFKLKIQRASSSSTGGVNKLRKDLSPSESFKSPFASSLDLGQGAALRRRKDPNLSVFPGQINSSHDKIYSSTQRTRFVDTFEAQSPTVSTLLPSPIGACSFFSDDSSQIRPKGTLRKRFSDFMARAAAARATSMEEPRGYDRGLLSSALGRSRASGRSSRQSQHTVGASTRTSVGRRRRWKMMDKIRLWLHRGEDKVRDWGWSMLYHKGRNRAASVPPYAGV